eukprot:UN32801
MELLLSSGFKRNFSTMRKSLNVLAFGSDNFTTYSLDRLWKEVQKDNSVINTMELVCPEDTASGSVHAKTWALENQCKIHEVPISAGFNLKTWSVPDQGKWDIGIVVSFGRYIPKHVRNVFPLGMINLHPSLLPQYRGASPIPYTILNGDKTSGFSIIDIADKMDEGAVYIQEVIDLPNRPTRPELFELLGTSGANAFVKLLKNHSYFNENKKSQSLLTEYKNFSTIPDIICAPKIPKSLANIQWNNDAYRIDRICRSVEGQFNCVTLF